MPTYEELALALNTLRLARKQSSQHMLRASYHAPVQPIFDALEAIETKEG